MSAAGRTSDLKIIAAAGAATVTISIASFLASPVGQEPAVDGSTYGSHRTGARAAYLALARAGARVERSFEPLALLRADPGNTILVLANPTTGPSELDRRALREFIEGGGIVLATGPVGAAFLPEMPRELMRPPQPAIEAPASVPGPLTRGIRSVRLPRAAALPPSSPYIAVFGDHGRPAVLAAEFGIGRAVWWSGPGPLTNEGIAGDGHAELLANTVVRDGRVVVWDEHYHGYTRSLWSYLAGTPVPFGLAQLGLVFAGALLAFSRRRWPVRRAQETPRTSPLEFIDAMGGLYERAGAAPGALQTVHARVRRRLSAACGLPASTGDRELSVRAARRLSLEAAEVERVLGQGAEAIRQGHVPPDTARRLVADLQRLGRHAVGLGVERPRVESPRRPQPFLSSAETKPAAGTN